MFNFSFWRKQSLLYVPSNLKSVVDQVRQSSSRFGTGATEHIDKDAQVLRLDDPEDLGVSLEDPFSAQMMVPNAPIIADRNALRRLHRSEVMMWSHPSGKLEKRFFRLMDKNVPLCCGACGHFFEQDEYEMSTLEHGRTPFARELSDS